MQSRRLVSLVVEGGAQRVSREVVALTSLRAGSEHIDHYLVVLQRRSWTRLELWKSPREGARRDEEAATYLVPARVDEDAEPSRALEDLLRAARRTTPTPHPTLFRLGRAALGAHESHGRHARRVIEPIAAAIRQYLTDRDGSTPASRARQGGLARWQEDRAKAMLSPERRATIEETARACELSRPHFSRAFRVSTGLSPREFGLRCRIEAAEAALATSTEPADTVARRFGFAGARHLALATKRLSPSAGTPLAARRGL